MAEPISQISRGAVLQFLLWQKLDSKQTGGSLSFLKKKFQDSRYGILPNGKSLAHITSYDCHYYLTNREALSTLQIFSVVKRAGRGWSTEEVWGETRDVVDCFSPLLDCSSRLLSALQQNRAKSRLLYLFYNEVSVKFFKLHFQSE